MDEIITLDYGSGGKKTSRLIERMILPALDNPALSELGDGAVLEGAEKLVFSTDSFVVDPIFFPGGDIGKLAVCGTVNDLAMCGGTPKYLSLALILEEGLPMADLKAIVASIADTAAACGVSVVTGDTKVVERGHGHGVYINTSGVGRLTWPGLSPANLRPGDRIILSGPMGDHGTAVMLARSGLLDGPALTSDCMPLHLLAAAVLDAGGVRVLRDPTRGGLATTLNEIAEQSSVCIDIEESLLPVHESVRNGCSFLGLDPLYLANEGKCICILPQDKAEAALRAMQASPYGKEAAIIGRVAEDGKPGQVRLRTRIGGQRLLGMLEGAQLPRIC